MRSQIHSSPDDIDISSLWSVLKRNGMRILGASGLVGLATFAGLSLVPAKYTSESQIRIGGQSISDPFRDPKVGSGPTFESVSVKVDKEAIASQVVALRSRDLAGKVASELKLNLRPEFNSALDGQGLGGGLMRMAGLSGPRPGETEEERIYAAYFKALQVFQVKDTRVITIEFSSNDNDLAARAANRLAELYQDWLRSQGVTQTEDASQWLKPQIEKLAKEVSEAEAEVERFRSQANLFRGGGISASLNEQQLTDMTSEVTKARTARGEAEARSRSARELVGRGSADAISEVQKSPVIQALIAQRVRAEREKAEADTTLLSGHPRMKQLNANVTDLRRQVNKEAMTIVEGLEKEAKALALREELAMKSLDEAKSRVGSKSGDIARLASMEGQSKAKRKELETLQASFEATRSRGDVKSVPLEAQLISTARPSSIPSSPKKAQMSALAAVATLILGLAFVMLRELFGSARRQGPAHVAGHAGAFAAAPSLGSEAPAAAQRQVRAPAPAPASRPASPAPVAAATVVATQASVDQIAQRMLANADSQGGYRTVITGETTAIDAREEAADLAGALAASGKQVVLVDWSFDGEGISRALGLEPAPGLMDLLDGRASFEDVIRRLPDGDAHVVPCGRAGEGQSSPDADRINLVLDALDEAYDHIVVTGANPVIRDLFLAIQGRFDAGIVVADPRRRAAAGEAPDGTFLGFQVTDIDVIRLDRPGAQGARKMQLARGASEAEARV